MSSLNAIAGPLKGAVFQFHAEEVSIGRLVSNQLRVGDPSVSRQDCVIRPREGRYEIRDLDSNNGIFVNGDRIVECLLSDGDRIRIGDTVFCFTLQDELPAEHELKLPDNGLLAVPTVQRQASDSVTTAIQRLFADAEPDEFASFARVPLHIGASLRCGQDPEALQLGLMQQILEVVPAEQVAVVLLSLGGAADVTVTGWNGRRGEAAAVAVSRTLVATAVFERAATFCDDVSAHREFTSPA
jgi:predicted component of type VI protein secretion system